MGFIRSISLYESAKNKSSVSPFDASAQLHLNWLSADITVYDFAPEGEFLASIYNSHKFMELLVIQSGKGTMYISGESPVPLESGSLVFINKNISHKLESDPEQPLRTYLISFMLTPRAPFEKVPRQWIEDEMLIIRKILGSDFLCAKDGCGCMHELDHILQSSKTRSLGEFVKIKNCMSNLIMSAFQSFTCLPVRPDFEDILLNAPAMSALRVIRYIRDHFTEKITLASVSESLFYSPRQCQRVIQDSLGVSFSDYLTDLRLSYAKDLLGSTNYSMEEVAERSGFKNGKSFSRLFQQREGTTPYRYRKEQT